MCVWRVEIAILCFVGPTLLPTSFITDMASHFTGCDTHSALHWGKKTIKYWKLLWLSLSNEMVIFRTPNVDCFLFLTSLIIGGSCWNLILTRAQYAHQRATMTPLFFCQHLCLFLPSLLHFWSGQLINTSCLSVAHVSALNQCTGYQGDYHKKAFFQLHCVFVCFFRPPTPSVSSMQCIWNQEAYLLIGCHLTIIHARLAHFCT